MRSLPPSTGSYCHRTTSTARPTAASAGSHGAVIFGCDAEPRAARTAKMNMIMHGDGHGGIHYHDGLVDLNGIFPDRFDIVVTNPPFGANVGSDQKVGGSDETRIPDDDDYRTDCLNRYPAENDTGNDIVQPRQDSGAAILIA